MQRATEKAAQLLELAKLLLEQEEHSRRAWVAAREGKQEVALTHGAQAHRAWKEARALRARVRAWL